MIRFKIDLKFETLPTYSLTRPLWRAKSLCRKLSLLWGWATCRHYQSGQSHICQMSLGLLGYLSTIMSLQQLLTWDYDVLSLSARSSKMTEEGSARKHPIASSGKLVRYANVNISSSRPTATSPIEKLYSFDNDSCAVVNRDPGICVFSCGTECGCVSVNAFACWVARPCGWLGGSHRLKLICKI